MTEYEAASLVLQQAALAAQQAAVWVAALVGAAQCSLIGVGLYIMRQASKQRDAQHRETMAAINAQREAQKEQHQETMAAHQETMKVLEGQNKALDNQQTAMMELIRRTSGAPAQEDG